MVKMGVGLKQKVQPFSLCNLEKKIWFEICTNDEIRDPLITCWNHCTLIEIRFLFMAYSVGQSESKAQGKGGIRTFSALGFKVEGKALLNVLLGIF